MEYSDGLSAEQLPPRKIVYIAPGVTPVVREPNTEYIYLPSLASDPASDTAVVAAAPYMNGHAHADSTADDAGAAYVNGYAHASTDAPFADHADDGSAGSDAPFDTHSNAVASDGAIDQIAAEGDTVAAIEVDCRALSKQDTLEDVEQIINRMAALHSQISEAKRQTIFQKIKDSRVPGASLGLLKKLYGQAVIDGMNARRMLVSSGEGDLATVMNWRDYLLLDAFGTPLANEFNAHLAGYSDPSMKNVIAYDEFKMKVYLMNRPPWDSGDFNDTWQPRIITNADQTYFSMWLQKQGINVKRSMVYDTMVTIAKEQSVNCRTDYLDRVAAAWDGVPRLDTWLITYLGVEKTDYAMAVGRKWLLSGVARAYQPGCKADYVLNLEGAQGAGKSTAFRIIAGGRETFWECADPLTHKDTWLNLQGHAVVELAELANVRKASVEDVKSFISKQEDKFRAPFDRMPEEHPRQCIFGGTVNKLADYLLDDTGNRRFWPVTVTAIDLVALARDVDQLWGEAVVRQRAGELWYPEKGVDAWFDIAAADETEKRTAEDIWHDAVSIWLRNNVTFYNGKVSETKPLDAQRNNITSPEILLYALDITTDKQNDGMKRRIAAIMTKLGYEQHVMKEKNALGQRMSVRVWRLVVVPVN